MFPRVDLIVLPQNIGFGAAINAGARESTARSLILMNNDARADPAFVRELVRTRDQSGAAMVAGCMVATDGTLESAGVVADRSLIVFDSRAPSTCHVFAGTQVELIIFQWVPFRPRLGLGSGTARVV